MKFLDTHALIRKYAIRPKKSLGQNFLIEPSGLRKVLSAAELQGDEQVLEVGAGLGSLTVLLAQNAREVIAIEIDQTLFPALQEAISQYKNVKTAHGDILELDLTNLLSDEPFVVVANIPYYITSAIIRKLLETQKRPTHMVLTIQKEVAERIIARDGKMSLLALSVQIYGKPELVATIPAGAFYPAPDVDSAVLKLSLYEQPIIEDANTDAFFKLATAGFSQKRKTLRNSLAAGLGISAQESEGLLDKAQIQSTRRAETLHLQEWQQLLDAYLTLQD
ncbi:MAG TPA: 16S rRNA (adenine(1518)-N(6)/adenine(1519)-N(6))-dimethyltransferase RsmA [Anaerolineaceae bacterium]|nr:16S rRNA (adenine(1518)-N(6)/adenine(1519)-N(6))-dimethyltransferase RsmA [Anaerolineaceae bacterium]